MKVIETNITKVWDRIDTWMNSGDKLISSEKSVVFNFAWEFQKEFKDDIAFIDFETSLFQNFSDGQFLDLFMKFRHANKEIKIGIEFKYPNKKQNNSNHTETRQKIINDIKRLNWLVANEKIDIGCFLCLTNENNYVNNGRFKVATNFLTHHEMKYQTGDFLPENGKYVEKVKSLTDINFHWKNVQLKKGKHVIADGKYAFLKPIFITKDQIKNTSTYAQHGIAKSGADAMLLD